MKRYGWCLFWLAAALLLFLGNGQLWITDSVESNYALTAKEMLQTGDWVSPQIYGHYWYDKPIFFYWLTALGFKMFGFTEFGARFFPALLGMAGLALAVYAGGKLYSGKTAFWGGVVLLPARSFSSSANPLLRTARCSFSSAWRWCFFTLVTARRTKIITTACTRAWRWQL